MTDHHLIRCLDHGFVRLVDHMGSDLSVVRAARNSFDAAWRTGADTGSDERLLAYLWKHRHTTPFEAVTFTFEVKAPIFVFRQWHRHRTWSYNEVSARYTEMADEFYVPRPEVVGRQSTTNKQGRDMVVVDNPENLLRSIEQYTRLCQQQFQAYQLLLEAGWPRELARTVLPLATYSKMFATVNLWNLLHFLTLRTDTHAQHEIQVYAWAMATLIEPVVPVVMTAWRNNRLPGWAMLDKK